MSEFNELWERIFGGENRIGWWTVPVFLAVGLFGAVVAGTLATIYYSQQVSAIEEQTRAVREDLGDAVDRVEDAAQQAIDQIQQQLASFREQVEGGAAALNPDEAGVVVVRANIPAPQPPPPESEPVPSPEPEPRGQPSPTLEASPAVARSPANALAGSGQVEAAQEVGGERIGVAFAVAREGGSTFFVTSMSVVAAPHLPGGTVDRVTVHAPGFNGTGTVHDWDEAHDAAVIRADVPSQVAQWRPADEQLGIGDRLFALAYTPAFQAIQVPLVVGVAEGASALFTDVPPMGLPAGAPLVDAEGRIVGVATPGFRPFGPSGGAASVPIRALCGPLLQQCGPQE